MPNLVYAPLEAIQQHRSGEVIEGHWWVYAPGKGVAFHRSGWGLDPQCNQDYKVAEIVQGRLYPDHELRYVRAAYLGRDEGKSIVTVAAP